MYLRQILEVDSLSFPSPPGNPYIAIPTPAPRPPVSAGLPIGVSTSVMVGTAISNLSCLLPSLVLSSALVPSFTPAALPLPTVLCPLCRQYES